ncbi:MAG: type II toxin-antitoxin system Phd/YefM family antitoxin [Ignavibacteriaceae bacterium]|nr:type II toxin-antitoxin system Phd/YefM family antitoxin [Ignavibacteriaceae bacterium]
MRTISVTNARKDLYNLIKETATASEPVHITGKNQNAVLISEEDWNSIQETLFLLSIPGMRESIIEAKNTPLEERLDHLT